MTSPSQSTRIVFTEGGKGGVAKTEVALSLVSWYQQNGIAPMLLDFDIENTGKSGLQNFFPAARKFNVHREGALDELFDACDGDQQIVLADLGAGAGDATAHWFDQAFEDAAELGIRFTAVGVTTNDAGAVQSILKWATVLQRKVDYVIVLNEMRESPCDFEYWHDEPGVKEFCKMFSPAMVTMAARVPELQAELRNQCVTLQDVIDGNVETAFLRKTKNIARAKRYQRQLFEGFANASHYLLP
ncbi:MAG: hypothetical protein KDN22_27970 [Verrucomicrobiae bacterium]|nr:hypothetical protein [Verrucomicrobiae bacterium]